MPGIVKAYIRNYKSIAQSAVELGSFTALVGPNGAGKSNFIDAFAFVGECLSESVELAFKNRGGISAVRRRSGGHPTHIGIRLALELKNNVKADYAFEIAARPGERFTISRERCVVDHFMGRPDNFEVRSGQFTKEIPGIRPKVAADRLMLFAASATDEFRPVYDFLTAMRFYSVVPIRLRELQEPDAGHFLKKDGSNAAAVLRRLEGTDRYDQLCRLLSRVVEGVQKVQYHGVGQKETVSFRQDVGTKYPWTFDALNMSDGTLRVLGLLLAVFQPDCPSVVGIEEPESTVHPAVTELLTEVLIDAANDCQILVTTHSPDMLDHKALKDTQLRVVTMQRGKTIVAPLWPATRDAIRRRLYTPGELLRANELSPDLQVAEKELAQFDLFAPPSLAVPREP